jgi:hypothetical protein
MKSPGQTVTGAELAMMLHAYSAKRPSGCQSHRNLKVAGLLSEQCNGDGVFIFADEWGEVGYARLFRRIAWRGVNCQGEKRDKLLPK